VTQYQYRLSKLLLLGLASAIYIYGPVTICVKKNDENLNADETQTRSQMMRISSGI